MTDAWYVAPGTKLVASIAADAGARLVKLGRRAYQRRQLIRGKLETDKELQRAIELAGKRLDRLAKDVPEVDRQSLIEFLESREAAQLVRQLYVLESTASALPSEIKSEFIAGMASWFGTTPATLEPHGGQVFDDFVIATNRAIDIARNDGDRQALEATVNFRHWQTQEHLVAIAERIAILSGQQADREAIARFEAGYRAQVMKREAVLRPPSFDRMEPHDVDLLYVAPRFLSTAQAPVSASRSEDDDAMSYDDFVSTMWRGVILGDPGGGKSSLIAKLCRDAVSECGPFAHSLFPTTPIVVVLRKFITAKQHEGVSIIDWIEREARSKYQIPEIPTGAFSYLLRSGRAFVLFDGLDEILEPDVRREVAGDIESFSNWWSQAPVLVLSRRAGYDEAPLSRQGFEVHHLGRFREREVAAYAHKWFEIAMPDDPAERAKRCAAFVQETKLVPDLRRNPLMLGLMANIYRGAGSIPENRPAVLNKCATMLFERWDADRRITSRLVSAGLTMRFEFLRRVMEDLAWWIYQDAQLQEGVRQSDLVGQTTAYLQDRVYEDGDEATAAASELVTLFAGRAWVFSDIGETPDGERLYQFAHQTFLEYFAAGHLEARFPEFNSFFNELWPMIRDGRSPELVQLALHLRGERNPETAQTIAQSLRVNQSIHESHATNLLATAASSLSFLAPPPADVRVTVNQILRHAGDLLDGGDRAIAEYRLLLPLAAASALSRRYVRQEAQAAAAGKGGRARAGMIALAAMGSADQAAAVP